MACPCMSAQVSNGWYYYVFEDKRVSTYTIDECARSDCVAKTVRAKQLKLYLA